MIEVEHRASLTEEKFMSLMNEMKGMFIRTDHENDTYYYPPHRDYEMTPEGREFLRLRIRNNESIFEHKNVVYNNGKKTHSVELPVRITEPEAFRKMLEILGFREHMAVEKTRHVFEDENFVIVLDDVKGLGYFIEIEKKNVSVNAIDDANEACAVRMIELGIETGSRLDTKGYVQLMEEKMG